jgi:lycopene beta-cyclase
VGGVTYDVILVGGGLQNGLVALALAAHERVLLLERGDRLGGNHTWSFHADDVPDALRPAIAPLVVAEHPGYDVRFPGLHRRLGSRYAVVTSDRFAQVVGDRLGDHVRLGAEVVRVDAPEVELASGEIFRAPLIVDARGPERASATEGGYQKFVGLEFLGRGPEVPVVMDATVPQSDGFRFVYTLPLGGDRVLVEDTYYSDDPTLDVPLLTARCREHAAALGLGEVVRRETGVLPIPFAAAPVVRQPGVVTGGYAGGWFHPTTGYSFPCAARLAAALADGDPEAAARTQRQQARFCLLLNRMLFRRFVPDERRNVLEHFYALPEDTIRRFYALALEPRDKLRIFCRRPPRGFRVWP